MDLARLREGWSSLETRSQITLVGAVLGVLLTFYFIYSYAGTQSYTAVASNLDPAQTGNAEKALASAGVGYKVAAGGTELDVPAGQLSEARIALASKGVLGSSPSSSFSAFSKSSLGTTDFQQQVQYQQALQDEIAQTIEQIQGVNSASVTLVLPQDTLFADQQSPASAAVLVNGGGNLDSGTIAGIARLVSSSVKGLDSKNVTITSDTGQLLWPTDDSGGGVSASAKLRADNLYASQLAAQVNAMLAATLGPNKALAQVNADLDVDQTTLAKVTYAKKGTPLTEETQTETLKSKGGGAAVPAGATTNTTTTGAAYAATTGTNGNSNYNNKTATTTYGVDKTIQHSVVAPGTVNKINVALMIDSSVPAAQVASVQKSVESLVGYTQSRGDSIAVTRLAFAKQSAAAAAKSSPLSALGNPLSIAKDALGVIGALIFLFLMRRALKRREGDASVPSPTWLRELESSVTVAELEAGVGVPQLPPGVAERRNAVHAQVEEIAENQPEAIASQVAAWMKE
ncbi:MAG TPA: flagellar basal-body MS-ring/collar protein FliF [Gaiellaceae bacterium]|nr:flagellar basal-body MS-ring/collar protein FliF [Gaiellaceae bacterium]